MKHIYRLILIVELLFLSVAAMGQTGGTMPQPAFHWRCTSGDTVLNFHPATTTPLLFDSIPFSKDYTMIVVYKPVADTEAAVWNLFFSDSIIRGLTTQRIILDDTRIQYSEGGDGSPAIHTLRQSSPNIADPHVVLSVGDSHIMVAEILYFDRRLDNAALRYVQSVLAIRYGVTLGPIDYLGGDGTHIWDHQRDSALFHHRITGLGCDTICGLSQLRSRSEMEGGMVTVATDSLPQGAYLLFGDDDAPLSFFQEESGIEVLSRRWKVQSVRLEDDAFSFIFDTRELPGPTDSLVLMVDGNIVMPSAVSPGEVRFDDVWMPSDSSIFTLARGPEFWQRAQNTFKNARHDVGNVGRTHFRLYPNPTTGKFNIEVSGAHQAEVSIYDLQGKLVATYSGNGRDRYCFQGTLPSGNVYYATITTENGSQTMKLIVK